MKYDFPKIDLHLHLDGSMLPDSAWEMAEERGVKCLPTTRRILRNL